MPWTHCSALSQNSSDTQMIVGAALHPLAEQELRRAVLHYQSEASNEVARAFVREVRQAIVLLKRHPLLGKPHPSGMRLLPLNRFPFSLVYHAVDRGPPYIYAVAHQRRRFEYWADRAKDSP